MYFQKFKQGLAWGAGFACSFFLLGWLLLGSFFSFNFGSEDQPDGWEITSSSSEIGSGQIPDATPFFDRSIDDQIAGSSAIVLVSFEDSPDGSREAFILEILKSEQGLKFPYMEGDKYPPMTYFPDENDHRAEGTIVFFVGNPPRVRASTGYDSKRIRSLGNIPMDLLEEKIDAEHDG